MTRRLFAGGWLNGFLGVLIFSFSLPATRVAVASLDPIFLTAARAAIAGLLGLCLLLALRAPHPAREHILPLVLVAGGGVIGFPLLTALALQHETSAHAIIFVGLLPIATAIFAVWRGAERPRPAFWLCSGAGSLLITAYAGGLSSLRGADALMLAAILVCGLAYAEGAKLSRSLGGWQVISWALVISLPFMLPLAVILRPAHLAAIPAPAWWSLAYVSLFSMLIGFVFWYRGLAQGGIAGVGQLQLLQPFMGLGLAALILHEHIQGSLFAMAGAVMLCAGLARRFASPAPLKPALSPAPP
jgi:drug/metabolite transporter (DMT)-like permease